MAKIKKPNTGYLTLVTQKFAEENGINFVYVLSQREIDNLSRMKGSLDPITMAKKLGGSASYEPGVFPIYMLGFVMQSSDIFSLL